VYHYCDSNTAIQYILHEKQIRLSNRRNSIDPIENKKPFISYLQTQNFDDEVKASVSRIKIRDLTLEKLANAKQLCLCMNDQSKYHNNENPQYRYEYYGFLKPRMWDQYADKYQGICLAFSLSALKENASDFKNGEIKYVDYNRFKLRHKSINVNEVEKMGLINIGSQNQKESKMIFLKNILIIKTKTNIDLFLFPTTSLII
jgi:hypothetical protein